MWAGLLCKRSLLCHVMCNLSRLEAEAHSLPGDMKFKTFDAMQAVAMADSSDDDDLPLATRVRAVSRKLVSGGKQVGRRTHACPCPRYTTGPQEGFCFCSRLQQIETGVNCRTAGDVSSHGQVSAARCRQAAAGLLADCCSAHSAAACADVSALLQRCAPSCSSV